MTVDRKLEARNYFGLFNYIKPVGTYALNLIFPPMCVHCGRVDSQFCDICLADLVDIPVTQQESEFEALDGLVSTGIHENLLQSAVQALKYNRALHVAPTLAQRMAHILQKQAWTFDSIVPVPLHTQRLQKRGYNQAKIIAEALASLVSVTCDDAALQKIENTRSQVGLSRNERIANVNAAFTVDSTIIMGKALLLVDDVYTTGATLNACAKVARQAGATAVYGITVTTARLN